MKDPIAELSANSINTPISRMISINGANHHFFLSLRKSHRSVRNSMSDVINLIQNVVRLLRALCLLTVDLFYQKRNSLKRGNPFPYSENI